MKRRLNWQKISRDELAAHLRTVEVIRSEAIGDANLYRCSGKEGETVAIALPGDVGLVIALQLDIPPALERRRMQPGENSPLDE